MTIKERALTAVKQNYAKFGLKGEELDKLASHIASGLNEEATDEELNTSVKSAEFYAEMMQSVGNRKQQEIEKKYVNYIPKPNEPVTPPATATAGLTLEQVQEMIAKATANSQKAINDAVAKATEPFIKQQEAARLKTLLNGHEKLKDIPQVFRDRYSLDKEEDLENVASRIEADYTSVKQAMVASGAFVEAPSTPSPQDETDDFIKQMEGFAERNAPKAPAN